MTQQVVEGGAIVDWCTATFQFEASTLPAFLKHLSFVTGYELQAVEPRALKGFTDGFVIHAWAKGEFVPLAVMCWGGESQRGRAMLDIPGASCGMVDWPSMRDFLEGLPESRLTRVDVAVDLVEGQYTVDDAVQWVQAGDFNCSGRNPSTRLDGDWLPVLAGESVRSVKGRTLYVGKARNGKGLRVYEKGRQLGDADSEWNRFEVQFGNRDRVLPFDLLVDPTRFFVGAYPALERIVAAAGERIATISNTASITIGRILTWVKASAGKWLHVLSSEVEASELVEAIRVCAVPR
ncbi:MAG: replication initiation factor domain-containing protein, partial [Anaerolineae bacterium]|nr:replication initiation factor domain-containing protein [Anaerolineae bacterium]